ncbi:MAG: hypothetical protein HKO92_07185 [Flavobacteriaceae bacterium]|nr:hypothetical protein [Bacteroidia bacterium]NNK82889.1 hypothetical protein [Flavobacteriaceae bacterium]
MKKIFFVCLFFLILSSCSTDNDNPEFYFEFVPIESVDMPLSFQHGEVYTIEYTYLRRTNCHFFSDLYFDRFENTRTVAVINTVYENLENTTCVELTDELVTGQFNFHVLNQNGVYTFKFWQGINQVGEDEYLIIEIPVIQ